MYAGASSGGTKGDILMYDGGNTERMKIDETIVRIQAQSADFRSATTFDITGATGMVIDTEDASAIQISAAGTSTTGNGGSVTTTAGATSVRFQFCSWFAFSFTLKATSHPHSMPREREVTSHQPVAFQLPRLAVPFQCRPVLALPPRRAISR